MGNVSYVFPNVSGIKQRGSLNERWILAEKYNCDFIEVPADFIKNKTEIEKTGLKICDFLNKEAIANLYQINTSKEQFKYILHSEPSLPRKDEFGHSKQAELKWFDSKWVDRFIAMQQSISEFFGLPPHAIEIHPGDRRNTIRDLLNSSKKIITQFEMIFGKQPLILIENRTGQIIQNGKGICNFLNLLEQEGDEFREKINLVLDIQQLYTSTKNNFKEHLLMIPFNRIKAFHIHYRHRMPEMSNEIPWKIVFSLINKIEGNIIINPEIHHENKVENTIKFCNNLLMTNTKEIESSQKSISDFL